MLWFSDSCFLSWTLSFDIQDWEEEHRYRKAQKYLPGLSSLQCLIRGGLISPKPLQPGTSRHATSWLFTNSSPNICCGDMWPSGGARSQTGDELRTWASPHLLLSWRRAEIVVQPLTTRPFLSLHLVCLLVWGQKGRQGPTKADWGPEGRTRMFAPAMCQWLCWACCPPCFGF